EIVHVRRRACVPVHRVRAQPLEDDACVVGAFGVQGVRDEFTEVNLLRQPDVVGQFARAVPELSDVAAFGHDLGQHRLFVVTTADDELTPTGDVGQHVA